MFKKFIAMLLCVVMMMNSFLSSYASEVGELLEEAMLYKVSQDEVAETEIEVNSSDVVVSENEKFEENEEISDLSEESEVDTYEEYVEEPEDDEEIVESEEYLEEPEDDEDGKDNNEENFEESEEDLEVSLEESSEDVEDLEESAENNEELEETEEIEEIVESTEISNEDTENIENIEESEEGVVENSKAFDEIEENSDNEDNKGNIEEFEEFVEEFETNVEDSKEELVEELKEETETSEINDETAEIEQKIEETEEVESTSGVEGIDDTISEEVVESQEEQENIIESSIEQVYVNDETTETAETEEASDVKVLETKDTMVVLEENKASEVITQDEKNIENLIATNSEADTQNVEIGETVENTKILLGEAENVCCIGSVNYISLEAAISAVQNGETIKMLKDIVRPSGGSAIDLGYGKDYIIDFDQKSLIETNDDTVAFVNMSSNTVTLKNIVWDLGIYSRNTLVDNYSGEVIVDKLKVNSVDATETEVFYSRGGKCIIKEGNIVLPRSDLFFVEDNTECNVKVEKGVYKVAKTVNSNMAGMFGLFDFEGGEYELTDTGMGAMLMGTFAGGDCSITINNVKATCNNLFFNSFGGTVDGNCNFNVMDNTFVFRNTDTIDYTGIIMEFFETNKEKVIYIFNKNKIKVLTQGCSFVKEIPGGVIDASVNVRVESGEFKFPDEDLELYKVEFINYSHGFDFVPGGGEYNVYAGNLIFTVTFDSKGGTEIPLQKIEEEHTCERPDDPVKEGNRFLGWYEVGTATKFNFNKKITKDTALEAHWTPIYYSVVFNSKGETVVESQNVAYGEKAVKPADPIKTKYKFLGWYKVGSSELYDFNQPVVKAITLEGHWEKIIVYYTVTFDSKGGSDIDAQVIEEGKTATEPKTPTMAGYLFSGWYLAGSDDAYNFSKKVTKNITLEAHWVEEIDRDHVTITFNSNGGSEVNSQRIRKGEKIVEPKAPTLKNKKFKGWFLGNSRTAFDFNIIVLDDITLIAQWENFSEEEEKKKEKERRIRSSSSGGGGSSSSAYGFPVTDAYGNVLRPGENMAFYQKPVVTESKGDKLSIVAWNINTSALMNFDIASYDPNSGMFTFDNNVPVRNEWLGIGNAEGKVEWFHSDANGAAIKSTFVNIGGETYYFNSEGKMQTEPITLNGVTYSFDRTPGMSEGRLIASF